MIFQTFYDLIFTLFAGATAVEWVSLVCTICATICTLFTVAIPFIIVFKVIRLIAR